MSCLQSRHDLRYLRRPGSSASAAPILKLKTTIRLIDYALTKDIPIALVKNPTGNFIAPSLDSTQEAVSNAVALNSLPAGDK